MGTESSLLLSRLLRLLLSLLPSLNLLLLVFCAAVLPMSVLLILVIFLIGAKILFDFHCRDDSAV